LTNTEITRGEAERRLADIAKAIRIKVDIMVHGIVEFQDGSRYAGLMAVYSDGLSNPRG